MPKDKNGDSHPASGEEHDEHEDPQEEPEEVEDEEEEEEEEEEEDDDEEYDEVKKKLIIKYEHFPKFSRPRTKNASFIKTRKCCNQVARSKRPSNVFSKSKLKKPKMRNQKWMMIR